MGVNYMAFSEWDPKRMGAGAGRKDPYSLAYHSELTPTLAMELAKYYEHMAYQMEAAGDKACYQMFNRAAELQNFAAGYTGL